MKNYVLIAFICVLIAVSMTGLTIFYDKKVSDPELTILAHIVLISTFFYLYFKKRSEK